MRTHFRSIPCVNFRAKDSEMDVDIPIVNFLDVAHGTQDFDLPSDRIAVLFETVPCKYETCTFVVPDHFHRKCEFQEAFLELSREDATKLQFLKNTHLFVEIKSMEDFATSCLNKTIFRSEEKVYIDLIALGLYSFSCYTTLKIKFAERPVVQPQIIHRVLYRLSNLNRSEHQFIPALQGGDLIGEEKIESEIVNGKRVIIDTWGGNCTRDLLVKVPNKVKSIEVLLNGYTLWKLSGDFIRHVVMPRMYSIEMSGDTQRHVYALPFQLNPNRTDYDHARGTINFSRIETIRLMMDFEESVSNCNVTIVQRYYNVLLDGFPRYAS